MDAKSAIDAAQSALRREAFDEAEKLLLPLAEKGNVETQSLLGATYQIQGKWDSAISWLRKAAEAGNGCAAHNLGVVYLTSPEPDPVEGRKWLQLAYDLGFEAQVASDPLWFKK